MTVAAVGTWGPPPDRLGLEALRGEVHVWRVPLGAGVPSARCLSADERERAAQFVFEEDRARFVEARRGLRTVLAGYLGVAPGSVAFEVSRGGKPSLPGRPLGFSLAYTAGLALVAVGASPRLGVDVERVRADVDAEAVVSVAFTHEERAALDALPPRRRRGAFFACWTRKEALAKALGQGLARAPDTYAVGLGPAPLRVRDVDEHGGAGTWTVRELSVGLPYAAALAVPAGVGRLRLWALPGPATPSTAWRRRWR